MVFVLVCFVFIGAHGFIVTFDRIWSICGVRIQKISAQEDAEQCIKMFRSVFR